MLRGHCGRPFSASHLWSWALQTNKEGAKGSFPGVHTSLRVWGSKYCVFGALLWKEGAGKEETAQKGDRKRRGE